MKREPPPIAMPGRIVHVVGRVTDEVFSFLGPALQALARNGHAQAVVMLDEQRYRHHVARLHESAGLLMTPSRRNPFKQWEVMHQACCSALGGARLHAVHLHGVLPALVGAQAVRAMQIDVPVFFSPHGSRLMGTLGSLGTLVHALLSTTRRAAIVNVPQESNAFEDWQSSELVESPVGEVFFAVARKEARHPLVVTGGRSQGVRSAERVSQLAVLLSGEDLHISFNWIGTVDEISRLRLNAANVGVLDVTGDAECAYRLAAGWVYLAPGATRGFPLFLVEAMAAGLPCVALDCVQHREVIRDGETGYLCATGREMIERIATLIDDPALRLRLGKAGRAAAKARFDETLFGAKLLAAYALP